jgi:aerobic carbon-monoxide dehydrogenase large subunit
MTDLSQYVVDHHIDFAAPQLIGARVPRVEDPRLVTGHGRYVGDHIVPRMLHVAFLRSTEAHALIRDVRVEEAQKGPGVAEILTGAMIATEVKQIRADAGYPSWQTSAMPALALDRVRFVGEPIAAVVASSRYAAEDAAALIEVDYEPLPVVMTMDQALDPAVSPIHEGWRSGCFVEHTIESGDVDAALAAAPNRLSFRFTTQRYAAVPLEGRAVLADFDPMSGMLTLWDATQVPHLIRAAVADHIGHPEHHLRVIAPDVGGGFGVKSMLFPEELVVAYAARRLRRPVRWLEDRAEHLSASPHARDARHDVEVAFGDDGVITGLRAEVVVDSGAYSIWPFTASMELGLSMATLPGPYRIRHFKAVGHAVATNKTPHGPYRGVARPASTFTTERTVDEIARFLRVDPLAIRRRNLIRSDEFPWRSAGGYVFDSGSYVEVLDKLEEVSELDKLRAQQAELRESGKLRGIGVACFNEQTAHSFAEYQKRGTTVVVGYDKAIVRMDASAHITVFVDTHSHGQGHETTLAQLVSAQLGVPLSDVRVSFGDTESAPSGMGTFASRSMVMGGGSVQLATRKLRDKILRVAAHMVEVDSADVVLDADGLHPAGVPNRAVTLREVAELVHLQSNKLPPGEDALLEATVAYRGEPGTGTFSNSAQLAVVDVDRDTGRVDVRAFYAVLDCGTIINPLIVEGQIHGGVAQGLGGALLEHCVYDEAGQPLATTLLDYRMPTSLDVPDIVVSHYCTPSPFTPSGVKGAGEAGMTGSPAAIANAVADALSGPGVLVNELPLTPDRVYRYLADGRDSGAQ